MSRIDQIYDLAALVPERNWGTAGGRRSVQDVVMNRLPAWMARLSGDLIYTWASEQYHYLDLEGPVETRNIVGSHMRDVLGRERFRKALPFVRAAFRTGKSTSLLTTAPCRLMIKLHITYIPSIDIETSNKHLIVYGQPMDDKCRECGQCPAGDKVDETEFEGPLNQTWAWSG